MSISTRLKPLLIVTLGSLLSLNSFAGEISETRSGSTRDPGDVLMIALPLSAYLSTLYYGDKEGAIQFTKALVTTGATTEAIKYAVGKTRPDGGSENSYPSGHTAAAFAGASFMYRRYGVGLGTPAYALAAYTGYSRIWANAHFIDDAMAGANVAFFVNEMYTSPFDSGMNLTMQNVEGGYALAISKPLGGKETPSRAPNYAPSNFAYWFTFGPADINDHRSAFTPGTGVLQYSDLENVNNPLTKSRMRLAYSGYKNWVFLADFEPFDIRDKGEPKSDFSAGDFTVAAGETIKHRYLNYKTQLAGYYNFSTNNAGSFYLGIALNYFYNKVEIENTTQQTQFENTEQELIAPLYFGWTYNIDKRWSLNLAGSHNEWGKGNFVDWEVGTSYRFSEKISGSAGYRRYKHEFSDSNYTDFLEFDALQLGLGYHF